MMRTVFGLTGLLCVVALAACSAPRSGTSSEAVQNIFPPPFERQIYPFEVRDASGRPYDHPFLGGFNLPRPQFADIDGDGDFDLFVQEVTGRVKFFEHIGTPEEPRFRWRTDHYGGLDIGEWYRFIDLDEDGDLDLLAEELFSYVRYFRNDGTPQEASFSLVTDSLKDAAGVPLFADRQNIPNLTDIDCDGLIDLFIGRIDGTVIRYESVGRDDVGLPRFQLVTERFEDIEIVAQIGTMHGANTLNFNDVDGDGDEDLFWGDYFEPGLLLIRNTGSCASPSFRNEPLSFPLDDPVRTSGYNDPVFADLDGDGDDDLFIGVLGGAFNPNHTASDNFYHLEVEDGVFTERTRRFLYGIDIGNESIPAFADLDADGDLDLLLSNKIASDDFETARIYHFENQGTATEPSFQLIGPLDIDGQFHYAPALADFDGDGDLDMLLGTWNKGLSFYRNTGSAEAPAFTLEEETYIKLTRGSNSTPALVDIDADGDLDLFVGESSGELNFYRNTGSAEAPTFELVTDNFDDIDVGRRSAPTFIDLDRDGDQDMVVGREADGLAFFRNDGTPQEAAFVPDSSFALPVPIYTIPAFPDIDADGDADFFSGGIGGGLVFFENRRF